MQSMEYDHEEGANGMEGGEDEIEENEFEEGEHEEDEGDYGEEFSSKKR